MTEQERKAAEAYLVEDHEMSPKYIGMYSDRAIKTMVLGVYTGTWETFMVDMGVTA